MADERRRDRLSRDELLLVQQRALRLWRDSDWLAKRKPRVYEAVRRMSADTVRVDLGGGTGESEQTPGYLVVGTPKATSSELRGTTGESRIPDLVWDLGDGLPFEAQSVDAVRLGGQVATLAAPVTAHLVRELARTIVVGGTVDLDEEVKTLGRALKAQGFVPDESGEHRYVLPQQRQSLADTAPPLVREVVQGQDVIREPRTPVPS